MNHEETQDATSSLQSQNLPDITKPIIETSCVIYFWECKLDVFPTNDDILALSVINPSWIRCDRFDSDELTKPSRLRTILSMSNLSLQINCDGQGYRREDGRYILPQCSSGLIRELSLSMLSMFVGFGTKKEQRPSSCRCRSSLGQASSWFTCSMLKEASNNSVQISG